MVEGLRALLVSAARLLGTPRRQAFRSFQRAAKDVDLSIRSWRSSLAETISSPTFTSAPNAVKLNDDELGLRYPLVSNFRPVSAIGMM